MKKFLSIICCACFLYAGYSAVFADEPVYKEYTVTVAEGETLWKLPVVIQKRARMCVKSFSALNRRTSLTPNIFIPVRF